MSETEQSQEQTLNSDQAAKNRKTLLLILAVSIAPIALAYFSFFTGIGVPKNTASFGEIINPAINLQGLLEQDNTELYKQMMENKKWHIFIPIGESCNKACQDILYVTRQVHIRLGEKSTRVDRVAVYSGSTDLEEKAAELKTEHPLLKTIAIEKKDWENFISRGVTDANPEIKPYYILVDQEGFAMMYYDNSVAGGDLLKDLKRALKHSIDFQ